MDLIGMTNLQEAKLAREAEICYTTMALVTDYDCWHPHHDAVTVAEVIENLREEQRKRAEDHPSCGKTPARGTDLQMPAHPSSTPS